MGKHQRSGIRQWVGVVVICLLCLAPKSARAPNLGGLVYVYVGIPLEVAFDITTLVYTFGNLSYAIKGERATAGWMYGGYITGVINMIAGVAWLAASSSWPDDTAMWLGVGHLILGSMDLGFTIWSSCQREPYKGYSERRYEHNSSTSLSVGPMLMPDSRGRPAFGVGFRLVNW